MTTQTDVETGTEQKLSPMYRVLVHNDDVTPMDLVVHVLSDIFRLELIRAMEVMMEAHNTGVAHVITEPLERAEFHIQQSHSLARGRGFPLTFTCEPED